VASVCTKALCNNIEGVPAMLGDAFGAGYVCDKGGKPWVQLAWRDAAPVGNPAYDAAASALLLRCAPGAFPSAAAMLSALFGALLGALALRVACFGAACEFSRDCACCCASTHVCETAGGAAGGRGGARGGGAAAAAAPPAEPEEGHTEDVVALLGFVGAQSLAAARAAGTEAETLQTIANGLKRGAAALEAQLSATRNSIAALEAAAARARSEEARGDNVCSAATRARDAIYPPSAPPASVEGSFALAASPPAELDDTGGSQPTSDGGGLGQHFGL
jgi:hypothetical protein